MLVQHALDERAEGLDRLAAIDELLARDGRGPSSAEEGDAEEGSAEAQESACARRGAESEREGRDAPELAVRAGDEGVQLGLEVEELGESRVVERALVLEFELTNELDGGLVRLALAEVLEDPQVQRPAQRDRQLSSSSKASRA